MPSKRDRPPSPAPPFPAGHPAPRTAVPAGPSPVGMGSRGTFCQTGGVACTAAPATGTGRLNSGNPPGDLRLARRCGARTRSGVPCRQPAMQNGRCRLHGGKSTGPRTAAGKDRVRVANLRHGTKSRAYIALRREAMEIRRGIARHALSLYLAGLVPKSALRSRSVPLSVSQHPESAAPLALSHSRPNGGGRRRGVTDWSIKDFAAPDERLTGPGRGSILSPETTGTRGARE